MITPALFARFASRQDESFAAKVNAALRNQFGGHAVKKATRSERRPREPAARRACACRARPSPAPSSIFGASGDLTHRKLFPALYALAVRDLLPDRFAVVGVARTEMTDDEFRRADEGGRAAVRPRRVDEEIWERLAAGMRYVCDRLRRRRRRGRGSSTRSTELDAASAAPRGNRVFYLAVPPAAIATIVEQLGDAPRRRAGWTRLIVEKPFGHDLASAPAA